MISPRWTARRAQAPRAASQSFACIVPTRGAVGAGAGGRRPVPESYRPQARGRSREARARAAPDLFGGGWAAPFAVTSQSVRFASKVGRPTKHGAGGWEPYPNFLILPYPARYQARSAPDAAATPHAQPSHAQPSNQRERRKKATQPSNAAEQRSHGAKPKDNRSTTKLATPKNEMASFVEVTRDSLPFGFPFLPDQNSDFFGGERRPVGLA